MNPRALLLVPLSAFAFGCGSSGGGGPAAPAQPTDPVAISPAAGAVVDSLTPMLVVKNAKGFDAGQATYDFVVLRPDDDGVVEEVAGVPAGAGQTSATPPQPLVRGGGYRWKAVAHGSSGTAESSPVAFEIGVTCEPGTDPWAKRVVDFFVTQCTRRTNLASLLDPTNVLGPPDARGAGNASYRGFMSLGQNGWVTVDMGVCIHDDPGPDVRVYQYIEFEAVTVRVSANPAGPWTFLGTKPCGDGGLPVSSNHCDFSLEGTGLKTVRYVRVEDAENFPCELAETRTEGADIDAIEALNIRK